MNNGKKMDYIKLPRKIIYKDRDNLKEFEVNNKNSINYYLFSRLKEMPIMYMEGALGTALRCFNNAYYICTLIQLEDFPELRIADYEQKLLEEKILFNEDICASSMAMVCLLLPLCDERWRQENNDLIKAIKFRFTHYRWIHSECRKSFENLAGSILPYIFELNHDDFSPRNIIEVIDTLRVRDIQDYAEYISERLDLLEDPHLRSQGVDMVIARIKKYQFELCKNCDYNPKKDCFEYSNCDGMNIIRDLNSEERVRNCYQESKKAIEYYTKHYPDEKNYQPKKQSDIKPSISDNEKLIAENEQLKEQLAQCVSQVNELVKDNAELKDIKQQLADAQETIYEQAQTIQELKDEIEELEKEDDSSKSSENLESELNRIKEIHENTLVALLKPAFFNIEDDARDFLRRIQGLDNQGVTDVAWQFLHDNKITPSKKGRFIWTVLKAANLYNATEQNWTGALRKSN